MPQHSALSTQHSALSTQHSALKRKFFCNLSLALSLVGVLALQACTPPANSVKPMPTASPLLLENVPNLLPPKSKINHLHFGLGDFKIQALILCGHTPEQAQASYGAANACYQSGGSPLWDTITSGPLIGVDGYCHVYARCEYSTGGNGDNDNGNDDDNDGNACPPDFIPVGFSESGAPICEPINNEENKPCEDAQAIFPSQLTPSVNAAQNLVQPISDPAPMNQDLGDWQKLMKRLKDRHTKIETELGKPKPNQNKISNLLTEANAAQAQLDELYPRIQSRVSQMDSARPALRSALNSVAQQPDFSQDAHADQQVNPLPQTLEGYRMAVANLVNQFESQIASTNTHDLMAAMNTFANEQELYGHLVRDILSEKLPLTPEEADADPNDEPLEKMNTPRKLIRWLNKRLGIQAAKLAEQQQYLQQFTEGSLQALNISPSDFNQAYYKQINQETFDSLDLSKASIEDLDLWLNQGSFRVQGEGAGQSDPTRARAQMQKQLAKISQRMQNIENGVLSYASDLHEFASRNPAPSKEQVKSLINTRERQIHSEFEILELEKERLLQIAAQYQAELGEEGRQKVKNVDDKIKNTKEKVLNQWLHNVRLAYCILQKNCQKAPPKQPEPSKPEKLLTCSQDTINRLNSLINQVGSSNYQLQSELSELKSKIELVRNQYNYKVTNHLSASSERGDLYGRTAEGMVAIKLSSSSTPLPTEPLFRIGVNVPGTEIDFITGRNIAGVPGQGSIYDVYTMGEIKTGKASSFKSNAKEKFIYASTENAKRFVYYVDTKNISTQLKQDLKEEHNKAQTSLPPGKTIVPFNPERDITRLQDIVPEILSCGQ